MQNEDRLEKLRPRFSYMQGKEQHKVDPLHRVLRWIHAAPGQREDFTDAFMDFYPDEKPTEKCGTTWPPAMPRTTASSSRKRPKDATSPSSSPATSRKKAKASTPPAPTTMTKVPTPTTRKGKGKAAASQHDDVGEGEGG